MKIETKYNLGDEVFIIEDKVIYKIYITGVSLDIDEEGTDIEYDYKQEYPQGLTGISIEDGGDYISEEDIYSSFKEAKKVLDKILDEEESKEKRRAQYNELKEEFDPCISYSMPSSVYNAYTALWKS